MRELKNVCHKLMQPLVINECLEQIFQKLKEEIVPKFEETFIEQKRKINELEERVQFKENTINQLLIKCDVMNNIVDVTVYADSWNRISKSKIMLRVVTNAICPRRYRSCS